MIRLWLKYGATNETQHLQKPLRLLNGKTPKKNKAQNIKKMSH